MINDGLSIISNSIEFFEHSFIILLDNQSSFGSKILIVFLLSNFEMNCLMSENLLDVSIYSTLNPDLIK